MSFAHFCPPWPASGYHSDITECGTGKRHSGSPKPSEPIPAHDCLQLLQGFAAFQNVSMTLVRCGHSLQAIRCFI